MDQYSVGKVKDSLRAVGQSTIEKLSQVREFQVEDLPWWEFVNSLQNETEGEGLFQARTCKLRYRLTLRLKSSDDKEFARLADVLFLHGFLPSRDAF